MPKIWRAVPRFLARVNWFLSLLCILSLYIIYDWITTIMEHSKHELKSRKNILYSLKKIVIEHPYLPITTNSPQRPLSSVSKVTVVEMFGCIPQRGFTGTPVMAASLYVFGKLPSYPSPKPTLTPTSHVREKCWLRGGVGGQFPRNT